MNTILKNTIPALMALAMLSCTKGRTLNEPGNLVPKTADQDPNVPSIQVNGVKLHSEAYGNPDSTIVVCIHGGPGNDYRALLNCKELANYGYRVVFYDQMGSGLSQRFPKQYYLDKGASLIDAMYDELGGVINYYRKSPTQKVLLIGESWGAMLASGYAGKFPSAVQGLALVEPGGLHWRDIESYIKRSRSFGLWGELLNDATYQDQFLTGGRDNHEILDYKFALTASKNDIVGEDNTLPQRFWRNGAVMSSAMFDVGKKYQVDFSTGLNRFNTPTLFFYSELNQAYQQSWAQEVSRPFPSVELYKINGTGHAGVLFDGKSWHEQTLPRLLTYFRSR